MDNLNELEKARKIISDTDRQMCELFQRRMDAVKVVSEYKKQHGLPIEDKKREAALISANSRLVSDAVYRSYYVDFLKKSIDISKDYQRRLSDGMRVAFSGVLGAFGHIAATRIFPDASAVSYPGFRAAYEAAENGECDCAVLPIENSFEGDVAQVMDLAFFGSLYINGVYDLSVDQHLFGLPGADIKDVTEVLSHPQALGQCADYIREKGFRTAEAVNTAVAASTVKQMNNPCVAAICSLEAGEEYGLRLLDRKINDSNVNTTRFAVFSRSREKSASAKTDFIILFTVKDEAGSLSKAVSVFSESGYNLKALKSRPAKDVIWNYYFFLEGSGDLSAPKEEKMLLELKKVCTQVRVIGVFDSEGKL